MWGAQNAAAFGQTNHPTRAEGRHDRRAPQTSDTIHHERKCRHVEVRSNREFSARIDAAFETQKTRDEAKRRYELDRQELKDAESELCDYAA